MTDYALEFGWEGDDGLGGRLISNIIDGSKTATCCPRSDYTDDELTEVFGSEGEIIDVLDAEGYVQCRVRMVAVYETTFGHPSPGVIRGEGYGDAESFRQDHAAAWSAEMEEDGDPLTADTILVVEEFELAE